jgi:hypothetical protein
MSLGRSVWIETMLADSRRHEYGGLIEVVSFVTLVALIALSGISVALVAALYAL